MKMKLFTVVCTALAGALLPEKNVAASPLVLSLPSIKWALEIEAPDFELQSFKIGTDGQDVRLMAQNKGAGIIMTAFLEKAAKEGGAHECREYYWNGLKESPVPKDEVKMSEDGDRVMVEFLVKEFKGQPIRQKNTFIFLSESGWWGRIHLSKVDYTPRDEKLFEDILAGVNINKNYEPDSTMFYYYGNNCFEQKKPLEAIEYFERALESYNVARKIGEDVRSMLFSQLLISYHMTGNSQKAEETYKRWGKPGSP